MKLEDALRKNSSAIAYLGKTFVRATRMKAGVLISSSITNSDGNRTITADTLKTADAVLVRHEEWEPEV